MREILFLIHISYWIKIDINGPIKTKKFKRKIDGEQKRNAKRL